MIDWETASAELSKKLDSTHVQPAKQFGPKGDYLEGWFCMAEANRIFGHGAWSYTVIKCDPVMQQERKIGKAQKDGWGVTYVATVRVKVDDVIREDVGAGHGYDADLGLAHESAIKEAVTDALKRSLRGFGNPFGLALYDKSRANVAEPAPEPTAQDLNIRDRLVAALDKNGPAFAKDAAFAKTHAALRTNAPELAAQVDAHAKQLTELQEKDAA